MVQPEEMDTRRFGSLRPTAAADIVGARSETQDVASVLEGDRDAAEALVRATYEGVFATLVRLCGNPDTAADLTQETYRTAWSSLSSFRGRARFSTWLYRIAYNTFLNQTRRPALMTPLDDEAQVADPGGGLDTLASRAQEDATLRRWVLELPDELRVVVAARFWGEVSTAEIAKLENISRSAVRKRLSRAKRILRRRIDSGDPS